MNSFEPCTSYPDYYSVVTISLDELVKSGVFSWNNTSLKNCFAALGDDAQTRLQTMFTERFMWREISIIPPGMWMQKLGYKIKYELVPKYKPLYDAIAEGDFSPLQGENEYHKRRNIDSEFPETLLAQNQVYASSGVDMEYQTIRSETGLDVAHDYALKWRGVDEQLMDELAIMFMDLYTVNYNGL